MVLLRALFSDSSHDSDDTSSDHHHPCDDGDDGDDGDELMASCVPIGDLRVRGKPEHIIRARECVAHTLDMCVEASGVRCTDPIGKATESK